MINNSRRNAAQVKRLSDGSSQTPEQGRHYSLQLIAGAIALFAMLYSVAGFAATSNIVSHRAFYEMSMGARLSNSPVVDVKGRSAFVMEHVCDGWRSVEDYALEFIGETGATEQVLSHFESWEALSGDKYSFDITENSTFLGKNEFAGFAQIDETGNGLAAFSVAQSDEITLPDDTYFPIRHLETILKSANDGETIFASTIFTGAKPEDALMTTNTVVGKWQSHNDNADDILGDDTGILAKDGYWPVRIAYFKPSAQTSEPEYEINFSMQRNGVVRAYEIDYGDFSIIANLTKVEDVTLASCS